MEIRKAKKEDVESIAGIYKACFPKESNHKLWVESSFSSYPRGVYYVILIEGQVCGYILWCVKNGFRDKTIIELEQIGIHPSSSGKGLGRTLIEITLKKFKDHLSSLGHDVGAIIVTTSEGNFAEKLYQSTLGVSRAALITGFGSGDEIILYNNRVNQDARKLAPITRALGLRAIMNIIEYTEKNKSDCLGIFRSNLGKYFAEQEFEEYEEFLDSLIMSSHYFVVFDQEEAIACGGYAKDDDVVVLAWGMVKHDHHGSGVGKFLLEYRIKCINKTYKSFPLKIDTSQHTQGFYEKYGFKTMNIEINGYSEGLDKVCMEYCGSDT